MGIMTNSTTHTLEVSGAVLAYDLREPATPGGLPPLFIFGSPMAAAGFVELVSHFEDRTVITYDPRGAERSTLDANAEVTTEVHGDDLHRVVEAVQLGPVDAFGTSGGAQNALAWITAHPEDARTVVAHEPPLVTLLEDGDMALAVQADIVATYQRDGFGPAMAKFIQLVMYEGLLPADYLDRPAPSPAMFGLPAEDDGSRDDLLLGRNLAMPAYQPDAEALRRSPVRLVPATGAVGEGTMARRGGEALADLLGVAPVAFPGDHAGFTVNEYAPGNDPAAFAATLDEVLAAS